MSGDTKDDRGGERQERAEARARESQERAEERARGKVERAEDRVREHSERAQQQVARALDRVAEAEDRAGRKVAEAVERAERAGLGAGVSAPTAAEVEPMIWFRQEPASRRPAHTRADISRAAVEIADSEGFEAVSMRRVAQRLGAGTMTLYHYVRNKDELITLMSDAVMAEILVPEEELSDHWRTALTQIARRTRGVFAAHQWIFERLGDGRPSPSGMRHFEQSLAAIGGLGLDRERTFEIIGQVDDYVFGYALREVQERDEHERGWPPEVMDFFERELATGNYPHVSAFFGTDDFRESFDQIVEIMAHEDRFTRGLDSLLDGIEVSLNPPK